MPSRIPPLRTRQIHLDFHTSPFIRDVGVDFDADEFAKTMAAAHVNSVTVFAKCHHGHLYYNTKRPERHPGLKRGLNLLGQQVEALHRRSEEHTSELQSPCNLVCRLLLEKKKKKHSHTP